MKVHIVNFYGTRNKGDELMLRGLIGQLEMLGIKKISVSTYYKSVEDKKKFDDIEFVESLSNISVHVKGKLTLFFSYLLMRLGFSNIAKKILIFSDNSYTKTFSCIEAADYVITTGGPFFTETTKKKVINYPTYNYITCFIELLYAHKVSIPYSVIGQSFGDIRFKSSKREFEFILNKAESVAGRESFSTQKILSSLNRKVDIGITPDLAISNNLYSLEVPVERKENLICINVRNMNDKMLKYLFSSEDDAKKLQEKYEEIISSSIKIILEKNSDYKVIFLSQAIGDDLTVSERIVNKANLDPSKFQIIDDKVDLQQYIELASKCKFAIVTRYHSMIISLITNTPFVSLGYSEKITGALHDYGMSNNLVRGKDFSVNTIINQFESSLDLDEKHHLEKKVNILRSKLSDYFCKLNLNI